MKTLHILKQTLYGLVVVCIIVGGFLLIASTFGVFGIRALIVVSGSMEPNIHMKSIVLLAPAQNYNLNDIITYKHSDREDVLVTHRIIAYRSVDNQISYTTKGDANEDPDGEPVVRENILGKVYLTLPYIGAVITFAQTVPGFILLIIVPACIIVYHELYSLKTALAKKLFQKPNKPKRTAGRRVVKNV